MNDFLNVHQGRPHRPPPAAARASASACSCSAPSPTPSLARRLELRAAPRRGCLPRTPRARGIPVEPGRHDVGEGRSPRPPTAPPSQRHGAAHNPFAPLPGTRPVGDEGRARPPASARAPRRSPQQLDGGSKSSSSSQGSTESGSSHSNQARPAEAEDGLPRRRRSSARCPPASNRKTPSCRPTRT